MTTKSDFNKRRRLKVLAQQAGHGLINFFASGGLGAVVEAAMEPEVELEEIQPIHAEPLMREAGGKLPRLVVSDHAIHLRGEHGGVLQGIAASEGEQFVVRRPAPQKIRKATGKFETIEPAMPSLGRRLAQIKEAR